MTETSELPDISPLVLAWFVDQSEHGKGALRTSRIDKFARNPIVSITSNGVRAEVKWKQVLFDAWSVINELATEAKRTNEEMEVA